MNRNYSNITSDSVSFFIGSEVEHTPAFGKKTLFVVGLQNVKDIEAILNDPFTVIGGPIEHIYFGANQSFPNLQYNDFENWNSWETMIKHFLDNYLCTLDIDLLNLEGMLEGGLCESPNFIPMISVKLPYIKLLNYNATLKIDDKDFNATNPGVWCHSVHALMDRRKFTDWTKYKKDTVIK